MEEEGLTKEVRLLSEKLIKLGTYYYKNREDFILRDLIEETKAIIKSEEKRLKKDNRYF